MSKQSKAGRPFLGKAKRVRLSMTLKPELVTRIEKRAALGGVSTSRMAESLIEMGLSAHDRLLARLGVDQRRVAALCRALGLRRLSLFGSVLTDRFGPKSDVDLLVEFKPGVVKTLLDRGHVQMEFEKLLGRRVDLAELRLIENPVRRREIIARRHEIYAG